jgi:hypothetical protein
MKKGWSLLAVFVVSLAIGVPMYVKSQVVNPHAALTYAGPATCLGNGCHDAQARALHASDHYQWQGHAQYITNGPSVQGKLHTAFNAY